MLDARLWPRREGKDVSDISLNAEEIKSGVNLSYWQLVRRRFLRNRYGVIGMIGCLFILISAIFADFIAPYHPETKDHKTI